MEAKAFTRFVRISPVKGRLIADQIRGKNIAEALNVVNFCARKGGAVVGKTLKSALANARAKEGMDLDALKVSKIWIDGGPFWKRFMPRAMGRATKIRKRMSHINIVLSDGKTAAKAQS
ncbi:MAG: 50S ribosomal protein L22 [Chlamydiae bacterium]|nr:50S ribosomal protein L22 [Chlamydiota bacterium]MBI3266286.1 50S ribosomal protein L22 [Chlamydiota bacterium]